jgi:hypothetical protein
MHNFGRRFWPALPTPVLTLQTVGQGTWRNTDSACRQRKFPVGAKRGENDDRAWTLLQVNRQFCAWRWLALFDLEPRPTVIIFVVRWPI